MDLVDKIHTPTRIFPQEELYGLTSQIRRSAVAVPSNIAEGVGRRGSNEFRQFLLSLGSLFELETQLRIAQRQWLTSSNIDDILPEINEIQRMVRALSSRIYQRSNRTSSSNH